MPQSEPDKKPYEKPAIKFEKKLEVMAAVCTGPGYKAGDGDESPGGNPGDFCGQIELHS